MKKRVMLISLLLFVWYLAANTLFTWHPVTENAAMADGDFVTIALPKGLELEFPRNWVVFSNNQRITLNTWVESKLDLSNIPLPNSKLSFAANYYDKSRKAVGIANVRYYSDVEITQGEARQISSEDVKVLDSVLKEGILRSMRALNMSVLSWSGTKKTFINGITTFIE